MLRRLPLAPEQPFLFASRVLHGDHRLFRSHRVAFSLAEPSVRQPGASKRRRVSGIWAEVEGARLFLRVRPRLDDARCRPAR